MYMAPPLFSAGGLLGTPLSVKADRHVVCDLK